jgi:beta-phosphoglucomutase
MTPPRRVHALLFDLDGTLVDSMPLHGRAWGRWHEEQGLAYDADAFLAGNAGRTNPEILGALLPRANAAELDAHAERKEQLYRELCGRELGLIKGADQVLVQARAQGFKLAVCTAAPPANIAVSLDRFGLRAHVDVVVCPADGLRGKPHPDLFLAAAQRLRVAPADCLVYEDALLGVEAARRAGMAAVVLTTSHPASAFAECANVIERIADFVGYRLPARG